MQVFTVNKVDASTNKVTLRTLVTSTRVILKSIAGLGKGDLVELDGNVLKARLSGFEYTVL